MEKEYVQAEAYAEPVTYGEVVTAEPIMGEVVGVRCPRRRIISRKRWTARRASCW